jgi:hypothetical protein
MELHETFGQIQRLIRPDHPVRHMAQTVRVDIYHTPAGVAKSGVQSDQAHQQSVSTNAFIKP